MDWQPVVGLAIGLFGVYQGITVKRGTWRGFERLYRNNDLPTLARNTPFALLPLGLMIVLGMLGGLLAPAFGMGIVTLVLFSSVPLMFLIAIAVAVRPPAFLKPHWIVDEEKAAGVTHVPLQGFDILVASILAIIGILTATSLVFLITRGLVAPGP